MSDTEIEFRVTFGSQYGGKFPSPHPFPAAHYDGWLAVYAPDELAARRAVIAAMGGAWSMIYSPQDVDGYPTPELVYPTTSAPYYPLGERGALRAVVADHNPADVTWQWLRSVAL